MRNKFLYFLIVFAILSNFAYAEDDYYPSQYYENGTRYLQSYQYSSAIIEFKKALRENPQDNSSKVGLINSYIARAAYYNNKSSEYTKAANDLRSALFYMKYYDDVSVDYSTMQAMGATQQNLDTVLNTVSFDKSPRNRYTTAKALRTQGEFAASAYEYYQIIDDNNFRKDSYIAIGDIMNILALPQKSAFYYERAVKLDAKNVDLHLKLARAYEAIGNTEGAANEYNYALQNSSEKEDILVSLEKIWQQKVAAAPNDAEAHANLGAVYQKQGNYQGAMEEYKKAEAINPSNATTRLNLGTLYQSQKNYDGAIAVYNSILQLYPNHVQAHIYKAQCLKELGQNEEAIREYKLASSYDPTNNEAKSQLFDLLKSTMPAEQVLSYLYQNVQNQPMSASTYYDFAYELHKAGKLDDSITYYNETIKFDPKNVDAYINLSQVYRQKKNLSLALSTITNAKGLFPENLEVKKQYDSIKAEISNNVYGEATKLFEQGNYQLAITNYSKVQPPTPDSLVGIAACYQALENYKFALDYYKKALALKPSDPDILYYIGSIYLNMDDYINAKSYLNKAIAIDKNNEKVKNLIKFIVEQENNTQLEKALNYYDVKKYVEAMKILNDILFKDSKNATAYYYRGMVYDAQSKYSLAIMDYQNAIRNSSDLTLAYYSLAIDYDSLGKYKEALINYRKYLETKPEENDYTKYARKRTLELRKYDTK